MRTLIGNTSMSRQIFPWSGAKTVGAKIIVGLKSDYHSRELLLRLLNVVVQKGDTVLAVHVQESSDDAFDPNSFYIHEDLCKSKKVDFQVKVCSGNCYITELSHQVRITFATALAVGCSSEWPKDATVKEMLRAVPPTCSLLIMNNEGKILFQKMGTSQRGSTAAPVGKPLSISSSYSQLLTKSDKNDSQQINDFCPILFHRLVSMEAKGCRRFTFEELKNATEKFSQKMLIGEGGQSPVYRAVLENGEGVAVKVLKTSQYSQQIFLREVEALGGLRHENLVQILGYCCSKELYAIVYNLMNSSLKHGLKQLKWCERLQIAVGVGKALEYLHSLCPPIIHRDVNSSNILLSQDKKPHLSDFGAAMLHVQTNKSSSKLEKPIHVIGGIGHLAPEYMMYGKVDEKTDVYAYGVVLLELITGKEAVRTTPMSNQDSLVAWARSMLTCGLSSLLMDPSLKGEYKEDEMERMIIVARLCLLPSSSRRPTIKTILGLLEEPSQWLEMQKTREGIPSPAQMGSEDESISNDVFPYDDSK